MHIYGEANQLVDYIINEAYQHERKIEYYRFSELPTTVRMFLIWTKVRSHHYE